jgi:hypothetical protein
MNQYSAFALIALLPVAYFLPLQQDPEQPKEVAPTVIEEETDIPFPIWMDMFQGDKDKAERHYLCGTGVREKYFIGIDVYGFAFYVEKEKALPLLKDAYTKGMKMKKVLKDKRFHDALMSDKYNKSMRWVMARDVDGEDVAEAFDDFLEPGIRAIANNKKDVDAGLKAMAVMRDYFASGELEEEDELIFLWETDGNMYTYLNGRKLGKIHNLHLCYALFDVFVGFDPVDEDGRENIYEGLINMVKRAK